MRIEFPDERIGFAEELLIEGAARVFRYRLAKTLAAMTEDEVRHAMGARVSSFLSSLDAISLRDFPDDETDAQIVDSLVEKILSDSSGKFPVGPFLALTLYRYHQDQPVVFGVDLVPDWFRASFLAYYLSSPRIFLSYGRSKAFLSSTSALMSNILVGLAEENPTPAIKEAFHNFVQKSNFIAMYFNESNLKPAYELRSDIFELFLASSGRVLDHRPKSKKSNRRLRVGILANHFSPQTETYATIPFYRHLDRSKFEVILISCTKTNHSLEAACARLADRMVFLPESWERAVDKIRLLDLDLMIIGSNVTAVCNLTMIISLHRLARIQIASVCSCTTTGFSSVDYFISGLLSEPADAQTHYSEKLVLLDGPAHCYDYTLEAPATPTENLSRAKLGISPSELVYVSGANFFKILPEVEEVWAQILSRTPGSRLILYPFNQNWSNSYPDEAFMRRLQGVLERHDVATERVIVLRPASSRADVLNRLSFCDVYLDSFPFSGATSLLDPLDAGLPTVTLDGTTFRGLVGPGILRSIAMEELIADDVQAYVDIAIKLANEPEERLRLAGIIRNRVGPAAAFYDTKRFGANVQSALEQMWREYEDGTLATWKAEAARVI
jgi:predicted O-linked N-acetylglucosamine transferase (SPINDLY family)